MVVRFEGKGDRIAWFVGVVCSILGIVCATVAVVHGYEHRTADGSSEVAR